MFDITATSNHWVVNPQHNLGLQLSVEGVDGECHTPAATRESLFQGHDSQPGEALSIQHSFPQIGYLKHIFPGFV